MPSLLTSLFRLIPPTFRAGYCPKSVQQLANDLISGTQITFLVQSGNFLYNYGSTTPTPENRIYPWLYTPTGQWFTFQFGLWVSPMDPAEFEPDFRKMWKPPVGTPPSAAWSLDSGDGSDPSTTPPTAISGATWDIDHDFDGVFPIGVGAVPGSNPAVTIALGDTGGNAQHTLTDAEGATGQHIHPFGETNQAQTGANDDAFFAKSAEQTVPNYLGHYITGSGTNIEQGLTKADLFTLPAGSAGAGVTPTPFSILPPYRGIYWLKHTIRKFYTLPA